MGRRFYKNAAEPSTETIEGSHFSQVGVESLCAAVLRYAYNDLLEAMFAATAIEYKDKSYNCHIYFEYLRSGRGGYSASQRGMEIAKGKVAELQYWFRSPKCKQYCKSVDGDWFIDQAKRHIEAWKDDKIPEWDARPTYDVQDSRINVKRENRNRDRWRKMRDEWRTERGL